MTSDTSYVVIQTNPSQTHQAHENTREAWDPNLSQEQFHRRESLLGNCEFARENLRTYALIEAKDLETLNLLSHLEVFLRPALVKQNKNHPKTEQVQAASVASVFTPSKYRRRGFATQLLIGVLSLLQKQGILISNLYSDVGPDFYSRLGWHVYSPNHLQMEVGESILGTFKKNPNVQLITEKDVLTRVVQQDCKLLEKEFELSTRLTFENPQVLLLPTEPVYHWFWERSNFHAVEVEDKATIFRLGAYVPDTPYFVTWYPDYLDKLLVILRIRLPNDEPNAIFEGFMRLAHEEARNNALTQVVIWNLDNKELKQHYGEEKGFAWVTRTRTLSSMAWLPDLNRTVDWYHNEKFCWA